MAEPQDIGVTGRIKTIELDYEGGDGHVLITDNSVTDVPIGRWFKIKVNVHAELLMNGSPFSVYPELWDLINGWTWGITLAGTGTMSLETGNPKECGFFKRESGPLNYLDRGETFPQNGATWIIPPEGLQIYKIKLWVTPMITDLVPKHEDWF